MSRLCCEMGCSRIEKRNVALLMCGLQKKHVQIICVAAIFPPVGHRPIAVPDFHKEIIIKP